MRYFSSLFIFILIVNIRYGGGIWHSWLDRDLSIAGRVVIADKHGNFNTKLIKIDRPIIRIPTLAIHCKPIIYQFVLII